MEYTMEETIRHYRLRATAAKKRALLVENVQLIDSTTTTNTTKDSTTKDIFDISTTNYSTTAYLLHASQLPNHSINGVIILEAKRVPDVLMYYPTNAYTITAEEIESIKRFIEIDTINFYNFCYLKERARATSTQ